MDVLPTMKASELTEKATNFAKDLAERLEDFNREHPEPEISEEEWSYIREQFGGKIPGPTPTELIPTFEEIFCSYIASRYVIIPES